MLGFLNRAAKKQLNQYSGNKDFLEAVCAAAALVAGADGDVSDDEVVAAVEAARNNPTLQSAYSQGDIESCMEAQLRRVKTMSGKAGLARELDDVAKKDPEVRDDVYLAALDVASSDGNVSPEERTVLLKIASRLGINPNKFEF